MSPRPPRSPLFPYTTSSDLITSPSGNGGSGRRRSGFHSPYPPGKKDVPTIASGTSFFPGGYGLRSEEHTSELQSLRHLVCRLLLEKKKTSNIKITTATAKTK